MKAVRKKLKNFGETKRDTTASLCEMTVKWALKTSANYTVV